MVDFYCPAAHLIVELVQPPFDPLFAVRTYEARDAWLRAHDLRVLRFRNEDIVRHLEVVLALIQREALRGIRSSKADSDTVN